MNIWLRSALSLAFVLVLAALWAYLYRHTQAVDTARHNRVLEQVRELKQIDSDWNVDVLKSQLDLTKHYDPLVRPLPRVHAIVQQLRADAQAVGGTALLQAVSGAEVALARKADIVDRFQRQNSVLKNSLRYLPTAYSQTQALIRERRGADASGRDALHLAQLEASVGALVADTLRFNAMPDAQGAAIARAAGDALRQTAAGHAPALRDAVDNILVHVEAVLRQRLVEAQLLTELTQVPKPAQIAAVASAFTTQFDEELRRQAEFQQYLLSFSGFVVLAVVAAIGSLIWRGATEIKRMEQVVKETTAALQESEAQLVHAEKMSMLGEVVSGIVHEINTPLGYLRSGLESARDNLQPVMPVEVVDETRALLADGVAGVDQINETIVNLLNFSRLDRSKIVVCRVENGLESTLRLASHLLKTRSLVRKYGETAEIQCDLSQLNQVFLNLIKNAAQAAPQTGGEVTVATSMADARTVRVDITDNGSGVAPELREKIFEPFFTTRHGTGTGLGLSISQKIVQAHGGRIEIDSRAGAGATFSILLPAAPPAALQNA